MGLTEKEAAELEDNLKTINSLMEFNLIKMENLAYKDIKKHGILQRIGNKISNVGKRLAKEVSEHPFKVLAAILIAVGAGVVIGNEVTANKRSIYNGEKEQM